VIISIIVILDVIYSLTSSKVFNIRLI